MQQSVPSVMDCAAGGVRTAVAVSNMEGDVWNGRVHMLTADYAIASAYNADCGVPSVDWIDDNSIVIGCDDGSVKVPLFASSERHPMATVICFAQVLRVSSDGTIADEASSIDHDDGVSVTAVGLASEAVSGSYDSTCAPLPSDRRCMVHAACHVYGIERDMWRAPASTLDRGSGKRPFARHTTCHHALCALNAECAVALGSPRPPAAAAESV